MKICVASHNQGKIREFNNILSALGYEVIGVSDVGIDLSQFEETGRTFEENALLKAEFVFNQTQIPTIADDSGLVLDAYPDILGVFSARFMGEDTPYDIKNEKILEMYETEPNRRCTFVSVIAYIDGQEPKTYTGTVEGTIAYAQKGNNGFGYDPLFIPFGYQHTYAELDDVVKNKMSHRALALMSFYRDMNHEE